MTDVTHAGCALNEITGGRVQDIGQHADQGGFADAVTAEKPVDAAGNVERLTDVLLKGYQAEATHTLKSKVSRT